MAVIDKINRFLRANNKLYIGNKEKEFIIIKGTYEKTLFNEGMPFFINEKLKIIIDINFPEVLPKVYLEKKETPKGFEHKFPDGTLCLGVPIELEEIAYNNELDVYLEKVIGSYLYSLYYFEKYNTFPYGERSHGLYGIIQYWSDEFHLKGSELSNCIKLYNIFVYAKTKKYRGHNQCPCGSGIIIRKCHGEELSKWMMNSNKIKFLENMEVIFSERQIFKG